MCGVFDEHGAVFVGEPAERIGLDGVSCVVDTGDGGCRARHCRCGGVGIDIPCIWFDIDENHGGTEHRRRRCRGNKGERRRHHLVTGTDSGGRVRRVECGRTGRDYNGGRAGQVRKRVLEAADRGAGGQPVPLQDLDDRGDVAL